MAAPREPPGLQIRRRELAELEEAAAAGSLQAKSRLTAARAGLRRQEEEYARRQRVAHMIGRPKS